MPEVSEVRARLDAVTAAMRAGGAWDVGRPDDAAFTDMGAFGMNTMAFEQWLRFVFVPNVEALIAAGGPWPDGSAVAVIAAREGDADPVIASLVEALAAFDALFAVPDEPPAATATPAPPAATPGRDNDAGWALLSKPGHTPADVEAAIVWFRRSIAGDPATAQAVGNLGKALVELGRDDEAVAELGRVAEGEGLLAGTAHNWLGWRLMTRNPAAALAHLRDATRLRPRWGVAWQNLARVLDATGEVVEACRAYGEAIACGDSHDDAFARDRRLQLEMQLLGRGEEVPPVPAEARADSAAFAIVRATAARLPTAHAFMIRPTTREAPYAIIGTIVDGRALGHAIVGATRDQILVSALVAKGDLLVFDSHWNASVDDGAAALLARLAAWDPAELSPLDAGMYLRDTVLGGKGWRWELGCHRPAAIAVCEATGEVRVIASARQGGGIEISLFPETIGGVAEIRVAETPARLLELAPAIAEATQRARAARDAFAARPFGIRIAAALVAGVLDRVREPTFHERYPAWPKAWLQDDADGVTLVWLEESAAGCEIRVGREQWTARTADELRAVLPAIAAAVAADRLRVRADRLKVHDRFRVLAPFGAFRAGDEIELAGDRYDGHDDVHAYHFRDLHEARGAWLSDDNAEDLVCLKDLDRYLAPLVR